MFSVLPSCLAANVCADAPNPRSSLSDPCSSASDEWKECLLECRGDLINDTSDSQRNIYSGIHYIFHLFVVTRTTNFHLHNIKGLRPSVTLDYSLRLTQSPSSQTGFHFTFVLPLKSCSSPSNPSIISITEMAKSTLHSIEFRTTVVKHADVPGRQCFTC